MKGRGRRAHPTQRERTAFDVTHHVRCHSKRAYESHRIAMVRATERGRELYAYRCRDCGWWHLTKRRPRRVPAG